MYVRQTSHLVPVILEAFQVVLLMLMSIYSIYRLCTIEPAVGGDPVNHSSDWEFFL